ncbi:MAG: C45 family peptidase [Acidobacteriota bacterium]|nr:C45 family peptidase [Acidobacteriota bacterium]
MIRCLPLHGSPASLGAQHGESYREDIRRYSDERVGLASDGTWAGRAATRDDVLGLAEAMLPAHRAYAPDLTEEMEAMAAASGLSAAEAVIVGGFTDFVDVVRGQAESVHEEDDCTAVLVPDALAEGQGFLAQTWDMHASATEYVVLLDIEPEVGPRSFVFSTVGCLGQIGLNEAGISIGINNLAAARGRLGVTWPFVVRKALQQTDIEAALACVVEADLAGAHNYLLFDHHGRGYNVEAMPDCRTVTKLEGSPLAHTNHCLDPDALQEQAPRPTALLESSQARLRRAYELLESVRPVTCEQLIELTRDPVAICQRSRPPYHLESSGAAIIRPASGELWAVWGLPNENEYEAFRFEHGPNG